MAVGSPAPTSRAKVGPDSTAPGRRTEHFARHLVRQQARVAVSNPLLAQATRAPGVEVRLDLQEHRAKRVRRHRDQRIAHALERRAQSRPPARGPAGNSASGR